MSIGLFDSGIGGLTVMKEVAHLLPHEDLIYLGDTARVPYGDRSAETIQKYTLEATSFLLEKKIKLLILACHTASSHSLDLVQRQSPVPVIGMIDCGVKALLAAAPHRRIAILGTKSTISSRIYEQKIRESAPHATIFSLACPLFVPLIEEGFTKHPATQLIVEHYLAPLKKENLEAILLACTHYPLIREQIEEVLGPYVAIIEPAAFAAQEAKNYLQSAFLLASPRERHLQFFSTDNPVKFAQSAQLFFGAQVKEVHHISLERNKNS